MRAAAFELLARSDVPAKVVIDEYLEIAHAFFPGDEPAFVNAALDRLARTARPSELDAIVPNGAKRS
jgi:N utilization substance protein B